MPIHIQAFWRDYPVNVTLPCRRHTRNQIYPVNVAFYPVDVTFYPVDVTLYPVAVTSGCVFFLLFNKLYAGKPIKPYKQRTNSLVGWYLLLMNKNINPFHLIKSICYAHSQYRMHIKEMAHDKNRRQCDAQGR